MRLKITNKIERNDLILKWVFAKYFRAHYNALWIYLHVAFSTRYFYWIFLVSKITWRKMWGLPAYGIACIARGYDGFWYPGSDITRRNRYRKLVVTRTFCFACQAWYRIDLERKPGKGTGVDILQVFSVATVAVHNATIMIHALYFYKANSNTRRNVRGDIFLSADISLSSVLLFNGWFFWTRKVIWISRKNIISQVRIVRGEHRTAVRSIQPIIPAIPITFYNVTWRLRIKKKERKLSES